MKFALYLQRLVPIIGVLLNKLRFPRLWTGLRVEIASEGRLVCGNGISLGEGTRIDLFKDGELVIGDDVQVGRNAYFWVDPKARLVVGAGTRIQDNCRFYGNVSIGRGCVFAPNVFAASGAHSFDTMPFRTILDQDRIAPVPDRAIQIFDDCWFGINVVVAPGVTIARGCVIGANSVVTRDLPPYSVAGGNPAGILRPRLIFTPKSRIDAERDEDLPYFYSGFEVNSGNKDGASVKDENFILAMQKPEVCGVRVCLAGDAGEIVYQDKRAAMPQEREVVEFPMNLASGALPFLKFQTNVRCRIYWAELI